MLMLVLGWRTLTTKGPIRAFANSSKYLKLLLFLEMFFVEIGHDVGH